MITTSSRWQNKVVDAPSPFRSIDESHRRHVSTSHKFSSDLLPGPAVTPRMDHSTPTRRAPGLFQSPPSSRTTQQQQRNSATLGMVENMSLNLSASERREKYSLRMVSPRRSPSVEGVTSIGDNEASSALYSKRMSPMRSHSTTSERPLSAANTDVVMDRGRLHSHAHRNYNDTIGAQWTPTRATSNSGSNGMTPVSSSNSVCGTPNSSARVTRPVLKNAESARTEAGHWKPFISKRVTTSTPTLVGVMKPEAITPASPYRLVPPFGVS